MAKVEVGLGKSQINILELAKSEVLDENGEAHKMVDLWQDRATIFVFLRHFGCVSCRAHAAQVWADRERYEKGGAKVVFIGNGHAHFIRVFKEDLNLGSAPVYTDPGLASFRAVGFRRGFLVSLGPRSLINGVKLFGEGHSQGSYDRASGDLWQLGGVVAIKKTGEIAYHFISEATGDFPPEKDFEEITRQNL